jgi:nucleoside-diphosphate-sugar epimerase
MQKVIITGGAGFIGSAVIKHLQEFGYEILCN